MITVDILNSKNDAESRDNFEQGEYCLPLLQSPQQRASCRILLVKLRGLQYVCLGDLVEINVSEQVTGGIRLVFSPPFEDIPSIIVSPVIDKGASLRRLATDILTLPSTVVEHVTTKVRR